MLLYSYYFPIFILVAHTLKEEHQSWRNLGQDLQCVHFPNYLEIYLFICCSSLCFCRLVSVCSHKCKVFCYTE